MKKTLWNTEKQLLVIPISSQVCEGLLSAQRFAQKRDWKSLCKWLTIQRIITQLLMDNVLLPNYRWAIAAFDLNFSTVLWQLLISWNAQKKKKVFPISKWSLWHSEHCEKRKVIGEPFRRRSRSLKPSALTAERSRDVQRGRSERMEGYKYSAEILSAVTGR